MARIPKRKLIPPSPNHGDPVLFAKMSDDVFEEMCVALFSREADIRQADLYGRPREPQFGIDILGERERGDGIEVVSCKCYGQIKRGQLVEWSNDFLKHWDARWRSQNVRRFVLAVAADVKSSARRAEIEAEKARFTTIGVTYEI